MRRVLTLGLIALFIFLSACTERSNEHVMISGIETLDSLVSYELSKGITNDTLFMGYTFGMTKKEVDRHTDKLLKASDLKLKNGDYVAEIATDHNAYNVKLGFYYYNDKLNELRLGFDNQSGFSSPVVDVYDISELYRLKYGRYDYAYISKEERIMNYAWVNGNRKIELNTNVNFGAMVLYIDTRVELAIAEENEAKKKKSINSL